MVKRNDFGMLKIFPKDLPPQTLEDIKKALKETVMAMCKELDDFVLRE